MRDDGRRFDAGTACARELIGAAHRVGIDAQPACTAGQVDQVRPGHEITYPRPHARIPIGAYAEIGGGAVKSIERVGIVQSTDGGGLVGEAEISFHAGDLLRRELPVPADIGADTACRVVERLAGSTASGNPAGDICNGHIIDVRA